MLVTADGTHTLTVFDLPSHETATQSFTISSNETTIVASSNANPAVVGQPVTYTATVAPVSPSGWAPGSLPPTGSVEFLDGGSPITDCGGSSGEPLTGEMATCAVGAYPSTGSHQITASYLPDGPFAASSTAPALTQAVNPATAMTSVLSSANPAAVGQAVTFTATVGVSAPGAATPTGYVEFLDETAGQPTGAPITACGGASGVPVNQGVATCGVTYTAPGDHSITAVYLGDSNVAGPAASSPISQSVGMATTVATVSSSPDPSVAGAPVTYTATVGVSAPGAGVPTGNVEFFDTDAPMASCAGAAGEPLGADGTATCTATYNGVGVHQISAVYLGDSDFAGSPVSPPITQTVGQAPTTTTVSTSDSAAVVGEGLTFTAQVGTPAGGGTPTGDVEFLDGTTPITSCGGTSGMPLTSGQATCALTYLAPGAHQITATYLGDDNFSGSATSAPLVQAVGRARSVTTVSFFPNPSVVGQAVTYRAQIAVVSPGSGTPTGHVVFRDRGVPISSCGGASGEPLTATAPTCTVAYTSTGIHRITAIYLGDGNFTSSTSAALAQTVGKAATATLVSSSANPGLAGQAITYTAHVAVVSPGAGNPTRRVLFVDAGAPIPSCGGKAGTALSGTGVARCVVVYTSPGTHQITATYLGDGNFTSSTSTALTQTVGKAATVTVVASSVNPVLAGHLVTLTATVSVVGARTMYPGGHVLFLDGTTPIVACGATTGEGLNAAGVAKCTTWFTSAGVHPITAAYGGGRRFSASATAIPVAETVNVATSTFLSPSANPALVDRAVTLTARVVAVLPGTGQAIGRVEFLAGGTPIATCGGATGVALGSTARATCVLTFTTPGTQDIVASFLGSGPFLPSASPTLSLLIKPGRG